MQFFASVSYIKPFFLILVSLCVVMFPCRPLCFFISLCHALLPSFPPSLFYFTVLFFFYSLPFSRVVTVVVFLHFLFNQVDPFRLTNTVNIHQVCMYITVLPKLLDGCLKRENTDFCRCLNIPFIFLLDAQISKRLFRFIHFSSDWNRFI